MQKHILVLVLMLVAMSSSAWAECGKLCDFLWWETATASDVQAELDAGADVSARTEKGATPLHGAAPLGTAEGVQLLITAGADVSARDGVGYTPLHMAAQFDAAETTEALITAGADLNIRNELGYTPLHMAAEWGTAAGGTAEGVQLLIAAGADVNTRNEYGYTPLLSAARWGPAKIIKEAIEPLITAGADITAKNELGRSVWDLAQKNEELEGTEALWALAEALGKCTRWRDAGWWKQATAADLQALLDAGGYNKLSDEDRATVWNLAKSSPLKGSAAYWALNDAQFK